MKRNIKPTFTTSRISTDGYFSGEFGNQLFQVAATLGAAYRSGGQAVFTRWVCPFSKRNYGALFPRLTFDESFRYQRIFIQRSFRFSAIPSLDSLDLRGTLQSPKYSPPLALLHEVFTMPEEIGEKVAAFRAHWPHEKWLAIHMRFYDRPARDAMPQMYTLPHTYYLRAIERLPQSLPVLLISNNAHKAETFGQEHLSGREWVVSSSDDSLVDFYLITQATAVIMSNSSFSWWGAYLNANNPQVCCPEHDKWFSVHARFDKYWNTSDLYPEHFLEIDF